MQTDWEQEIDDAKEYVRKLNVISTNKDKEMEVDDEKDDFEVSGLQICQHTFSEEANLKHCLEVNSIIIMEIIFFLLLKKSFQLG